MTHQTIGAELARQSLPGFKKWFRAGILSAAMLPQLGGAAEALPDSNAVAIAALKQATLSQGFVQRAIRLEGTVRAVVPGQGFLVLEDTSGVVLLEMPHLPAAITPGSQVVVAAHNCSLARTRFGLRIGPPLTIANDGLHPPSAKSGRVWLEAGFQPIQSGWFNGPGQSTLKVEYEGPGVPRQRIPGARLWHTERGGTGSAALKPGLEFTAYNGLDWLKLPDFEKEHPVAQGIATNIDLFYSARATNTALRFGGYLELRTAGTYSFYLESDDGARLELGKEVVSCLVSRPGEPAPAPRLDPTSEDRLAPRWVKWEGEATFAGLAGSSLELTLVEAGNRVPVTVIDGSGLSGTNLLHHRLQVEGICERSPELSDRKSLWLTVPSANQIWLVASAEAGTHRIFTNEVLTTAAQVRRLTAEEAKLRLPVRLTGVVIAAELTSLVLQDASGGLFIHFNGNNSPGQPQVGDLWEIEGTTDPGDFSPVLFGTNGVFLGRAAMPEPIRPAWDQLMNGSLDAEYVELHGVLIGVSESQWRLLTADGTVTIDGDSERPLPAAGSDALAGSILRLRGCFTSQWNAQTRQVIGGECFLWPAVVEVEEQPPAEPFELPRRKTADLLWFDARASALQRTKVAGQIIHVRSGEYFVLDDRTGLRVLAAAAPEIHAGDLIEAVGFPRLGGPSPVLQAAQMRKTGHTGWPQPVPVPAEGLLDQNRDATLVQVEATLASETIHRDERVMELQAGLHRFAALLKAGSHRWPMLALGTRLRVTGVYASASEQGARAGLAPFELLLGDAGDITILQKPPWWTVRHALTLASVLAGTLGLAFIWITLLRQKVEQRTAQLADEIRARQIVEQNRVLEQERTRVARDLHDELGAGLTEVGILGELAKNPEVPQTEKTTYLEQLTTSARALVSNLDEIVWAINPHYDSLGSVVTYYCFFADRFLKLSGIACRLRIAESFPEHSLDAKVRHGVFLALKEALNNVVRHAGATEVELKIELIGDELAISVRDNGRGLPAADANPGSDGLIGMRQRLQQLGGECKVFSQPGQGTTIVFSLPVRTPIAQATEL